MAMIVPAESIPRDFPNAKNIYILYQIRQLMSTEFGFVPIIGDEKVTFVHRDTFIPRYRNKGLAGQHFPIWNTM